eukprot:IDg11558t1
MEHPDSYKLLMLRVKDKKRKRYDLDLEKFLQFLQGYGCREFGTSDELDLLLCSYCTYLYDKIGGGGNSYTTRALCAIELYFPDLRGSFRLIFPVLERWTRTQVHTSYPPLLMQLSLCTAYSMMEKSNFSMAVAIIL